MVEAYITRPSIVRYSEEYADTKCRRSLANGKCLLKKTHEDTDGNLNANVGEKPPIASNAVAQSFRSDLR
jgi:hypothetical protein